MSTSILLLALIVAQGGEATAQPAEAGPPTMLVLKTRQAMEVQSYEVKGRLVHIVGLDGAPLTLRTDMVDFEASKALTEHKAKEHEAAIAAAAAAEEKAEEERKAAEERRAEMEKRNAAHRAMSGGGGFSVIGTSGPDSGVGRPAARRDGEAAAAASDTPETPEEWTQKMNDIRSQHGEAKSERKALSDAIDGLLQASNTNTPADVANRQKIREMRAEMAELDQKIRTLETDFDRAREGARRSGAPAAVWRNPL